MHIKTARTNVGTELSNNSPRSGFRIVFPVKAPFNRKFYPWGREDGNLVSFYRSLARVKKSAPALRSGTVLVLEAGGGRLLLLRQSVEGSVAVCCNQSPEPWTLPHSGTILLGGGIMEYTGETVTLGQGGFCAMERK